MTTSLLTENPAFCPLPWMHLHVSPNGKVRNCCISNQVGDLKEATLSEVWNNEVVRKVRLDLLSGQTPPTCKVCENKENQGIHSLRTISRAGWEVDTRLTQQDGSLLDFNLQYIDFRFNNLCNFKCITCGPNESSSIANESNMPILIFAGADKLQLLNEFRNQYQTVQKIYFAGGEPMVQAEHLTVLKELIASGRAKEITLMYSTNGSTLEFKQTFIPDLWKEFQRVDIMFSIDAFQKGAEYWRFGTKWDQIERNIRTVTELNLPHISTCIHSVIGWPNLMSWVELVKHCCATNLLNADNKVTVWCLDNPPFFSLSRIPEFKKLQIAATLDQLERDSSSYLVPGVIPKIRIALAQDAFSGPINFSSIRRRDKIRNNRFFEAFPEHEDMRDHITHYDL